MNCPKCGAVISDGSLYCEACGEDIHIVPDFEPEIEYSIKETLSNLMGELAESEPLNPQEGAYEPKQHKPLKYSKGLLIAGTLCVTVLVVFLIGTGIHFYRYNSLEYQLGRAAQCLTSKQYEESVAYYERALLLDGENISTKFLLSDVYYVIDRKQDAVNLLCEIVYSANNGGAVSTEDLIKAYTKIINIYEEQGNYKVLRDLLNECKNQDVFALFQEYSAKEPSFSYEEGTYDTVIPLKLTATTAGTVYYTLDGKKPDEESQVYTTPIFLETGDYVVSAVFVNRYGIASEVVTKEYKVEVLRPAAPEISVDSGDFNYPTLIEVEVPEGYEVYYTEDGTQPSDNSSKYTAPIPMPLGFSSFRFITYDENDLQSEVVVKNFDLELYTEITPQNAVYRVMEALVVRGKLYDFNGNSPETDGKYQYRFQYAIVIETAGDFYIISETIQDSSGNKDRTGTNYAVDIYTGDCYKLYLEEDGSYRVESF